MSVHPTALVDPGATIAEDVEIGPYSIIGSQVTIEPGCRIASQVNLIGKVSIGKNSEIGIGSVIGADPQAVDFDPSIESGVRIGERNRLREYVTIHRSLDAGKQTLVGDDNFLMTGAHLGHDVILGNHNVIANNCLLAGHVTVEDRCFLGGGSVFHQFIRIGSYVITQGLTAMGQDIPPFLMAAGTNQIGGLNIVGMRRAGFDPSDRKEIKRAFKLVYSQGLNLPQALKEAAKQEWSAPAEALLTFLRAESHRGVCLNLHRERRKDR